VSTTSHSGSGTNLVFGDKRLHGLERRTATPPTLDLVESTSYGVGGGDQITTGTGNNLIVGGFGEDVIKGRRHRHPGQRQRATSSSATTAGSPAALHQTVRDPASAARPALAITLAKVEDARRNDIGAPRRDH